MIESKILCLADNSSAAAVGYQLSQVFAQKKKLKLQGLLQENTIIKNGVYHVGPYDMKTKNILLLAKNFNQIIVLNQKQEQYSHHRIFLAMFKLITDLTENGFVVEHEDKQIFDYLYYWTDFFSKNRSFCALPFLEHHDGFNKGHLHLCGRSFEPCTKNQFKKDWLNDPKFVAIRKKMIAGEKIDACKVCNEYEEKNIKDQRWNFSFDWIAKFQIKNLQDFKKFKSPVYYDVRPSSQCNIQCRMCNEKTSHLIAKERKKIKDKKFLELSNNNYNDSFTKKNTFDHIDVSKLHRIYISGGEPTIMPQVLNFLKNCVKNKQIDFEIKIQTNSVHISDDFYHTIKNFKNLTMCCSLDGVDKVNEYQRWGTNSEIQRQNIHKFYKQGHKVHITHVVSIYNIASIGKTLQYVDKEFPYATFQLQWATFASNLLSPYNHPNKDMVLKSLEEAKNSLCYWNNESGTTSIINNLYDNYFQNHNVNFQTLKNFFYYNDTLDRIRGSKLGDYIPELEECRKYIK